MNTSKDLISLQFDSLNEYIGYLKEIDRTADPHQHMELIFTANLNESEVELALNGFNARLLQN